MGQAAYDMNAVRRRKAPQTQRKADLRVAKGGKRRLSPLQAAVHNAMHLVAAALLVGFAISLLWSESRLVEYVLQQHPEQQDQHYQRGRNRQPAWPDEDRPEPDHLHPSGRERYAGTYPVRCAAVDRFPL